MKIKDIKVPDEEQDQSFDEEEDYDDDEGSYIEIALEPKRRWDKAEQIFQFRLSFSTLLPRNSDSDGSFRRKFLMPTESVKSTGSENYIFSSDSSSISSCSSSTSAVLGRSNARRNPSGMILATPVKAKSTLPETNILEKENKWRRVIQLLAAQRLVKLMILNLRKTPENTRPYDTRTKTEARSRKQSKVSKVIYTGLMKLIIKFRTIKEKSKISLTRASNLISGPEHVTNNTERLSYSCYESPVIEPLSVKERKRGNKSRLPEVSINSVKGMIDSLTVSCPGSIKSSPIRRSYCATEITTYSRENSIKAAIAHCKMSFDQAASQPDFSQWDK